MEVNLRIKELRKKKGLTQHQFAKDFKVSQPKISKWENRVNDPKFEDLMKIAVYFNVTVDYLMGFSDEENKYRINKIKNMK